MKSLYLHVTATVNERHEDLLIYCMEDFWSMELFGAIDRDGETVILAGGGVDTIVSDSTSLDAMNELASQLFHVTEEFFPLTIDANYGELVKIFRQEDFDYLTESAYAKE